jgi:hypothetical protein
MVIEKKNKLSSWVAFDFSLAKPAAKCVSQEGAWTPQWSLYLNDHILILLHTQESLTLIASWWGIKLLSYILGYFSKTKFWTFYLTLLWTEKPTFSCKFNKNRSSGTSTKRDSVIVSFKMKLRVLVLVFSALFRTSHGMVADLYLNKDKFGTNGECNSIMNNLLYMRPLRSHKTDENPYSNFRRVL